MTDYVAVVKKAKDEILSLRTINADLEETITQLEERVRELENIVSAARDLIRSLSGPSEPTNLAKSPAAAFLFAERLQELLEALGGS